MKHPAARGKAASKVLTGAIISFFSLILTLVGIEIYFRVTLPKGRLGEISQPSRSPRIVYELKPDMSIIDDGSYVKMRPVRVSTNSQGFRDTEYSLKKGENTRRILVIGDSDTFGMGVELEETFSKRLEGLLNSHSSKKRYGKIKFEVINMGVFGYNTRQEVEFLKKKGLPFEPDQVIVQFNENDYMGTQKVPSSLLRWVLIRSYLARYLLYRKEMLWLLRRDVGNPLEGFRNVLGAFQDLEVLSQQHSFKVIVVFLDKPGVRTMVIQKECQKFGFAVVDMWKNLAFVPLHKRYGPDLHPSAYSHSVIAKILFDYMRRKRWVH